MLECADQRFRIERLICCGRSSCSTSRPATGDGVVGKRLDKVFDDVVAAGEVFERETGAAGVERA